MSKKWEKRNEARKEKDNKKGKKLERGKEAK